MFTRFAALTLVDPTTAPYVAARATAQRPPSAAARPGLSSSPVFVGLVRVAAVAGGGRLAGARISDRARAWTFRAGYGLVAVYAVKVALPLP